MPKLSVLTYNVLFNKAYKNLESILLKWRPEIVCLQEVDTSEENLKRIGYFGYKLSDYTNSFIKFGRIFGIATFYNPEKLYFRGALSVNLSKNITETLLNLLRILLGMNQPRSVLKTDFLYKPLKKKLTVCNVHLIFIATNAVRLRHIEETLNTLEIRPNSPFIISGDFNYYPYNRKKLENIMKKYGLKEATKNLRYSVDFSKDGKFEQFNIVQRLFVKIYNKTYINRLKPDYTFYKGVRLVETKRIDVRFSDHYPIISTFEIV